MKFVIFLACLFALALAEEEATNQETSNSTMAASSQSEMSSDKEMTETSSNSTHHAETESETSKDTTVTPKTEPSSAKEPSAQGSKKNDASSMVVLTQALILGACLHLVA